MHLDLLESRGISPLRRPPGPRRFLSLRSGSTFCRCFRTSSGGGSTLTGPASTSQTESAACYSWWSSRISSSPSREPVASAEARDGISRKAVADFTRGFGWENCISLTASTVANASNSAYPVSVSGDTAFLNICYISLKV